MKKNILFYIIITQLTSLSAFGVNLQKFTFSNSSTFATVEDGLSNKQLFHNNKYPYIFTTSYNYVRAPFIEIKENKRTNTFIEWMHSLSLGGAYNISPKAQVGIKTFATYTNAIAENSTDDHEKKYVPGDSSLEFKYLLTQWKTSAITLLTKAILPTGDSKYYTSDRSNGFHLGFIFDQTFKNVQLAINIAHKESNNAIYKDIDYRQQLHFSIGTLLSLTDTLALTADFYKDTPYDLENKQSPNEVLVGLRKSYKQKFALFTGLGSGSNKESSSTDLRAYIGFKYFPQKEKKSLKIHKEEKRHGLFSKLYTIYFKTGSSKLEKSQRKTLIECINYHKKEEDINKIIIEGYTSKIGENLKNKKLSKERAIAVLNYLYTNNIKSNQLEFASHGNSKADQINSNNKLDRKVEVRIYKKR